MTWENAVTAAGYAGALLLGVALAVQCGRADSLRAELAAAQGELATAKANLSRIERERAELESALLENQRTAAALAAERRKLDAKLKDAKKASPAVRGWADAPLPGDVARLLREDGGAD